jgi:hypothetical protein
VLFCSMSFVQMVDQQTSTAPQKHGPLGDCTSTLNCPKGECTGTKNLKGQFKVPYKSVDPKSLTVEENVAIGWPC